jgi:tRNA modification GTPase
MNFKDTIAAIATPSGIGGIGVIRISGADAENIAYSIFRPHLKGRLFSHRLYHGNIVSVETNETIDEVLIAFFRGPHSYTGEDSLEIYCHGGVLVVRAVLEEVFQAGARPADHGEFTRRAFLNNRLDLAQAQAVNDLISAQTASGTKIALSQLKGALSNQIEQIRADLIDSLSEIEAAIDFTEEDGFNENEDLLSPFIDKTVEKISSLCDSYKYGKIHREGFNIVISGRPNVGKSSLLNRLLGEQRAIVSAISGTTRDFIEEALNLDGIPVRLTDTAGLRTPQDEIEKEGIALLEKKLDQADAVLFLLDGSEDIRPDDQRLAERIRDRPCVLILNKSDLPQHLDETALTGLFNTTIPPLVKVSAKYGDGIDLLISTIQKIALQTTTAGESFGATISHLHQKASLEKAKKCLMRAADGHRKGLSPELIALEIREALDRIGEITGKTTTQDILDRIFSKFCIGK